MLARLWIGLRERVQVDWEDADKAWLYRRGLLLSLIEPFWGAQWIKRSFKLIAKEDNWSNWVKDKNQEWIYIDRDVLAVQAANDMAAIEAEITTSLVLVLMEDVPSFVIQLLFCFLAFTKEQFTLQDPVLVLTVVTTLLHLCKQLAEVWQLQCDLPRLRCRIKAGALAGGT